MSKKPFSLCLCALVVIALPLFADHSTAAYDCTRVVKMKGTVTSLDWRNPHVHIHVNIPESHGKLIDWDVETWGTGQMAVRGVTNTLLRPGDRVSIDGFVAKDGTHRAFVRLLTLPDGTAVDGPPADITNE